MLFNSMQFLIFFPAVVLMYFIIPYRIKNLWLLAASYFFYMCWNARYALLLLFSTFLTYASGFMIEYIQGKDWEASNKARCKKGIMITGLVLNLGILFYFKYTNFFLDMLRGAFSVLHLELQIPVFDILLPVGISFYIFQALSYMIDVYRGEIRAEKNFFRYALFVSFFPQLVAGPIERSKNLLKQMEQPKRFDYDRVRAGLLTMLWGYFLKLVIADRCAVLVNTVYGDYTAYYGFQLITAGILFSFQIYCDFMGYSIIAKGAAKVLGYELMDNFRQPYLAQSVKDFWRRWHISLSFWLRDYLYISLGGNRGSKLMKYRNVMITFLVSGLWHGAAFTYVFWGFLHGLYQVLEDALSPFFSAVYEKRKIDTQAFSWKCLRILKTFVLADLAFVFFRADSIRSALVILKRSLVLTNLGQILTGGLCQLGLDGRNMFLLLLGLAALAVCSLMREAGRDVSAWLSRQNAVFRYGAYWSAVLLILFSLDISGQEFLYFQF